jgi:tetratricopeptide (TPR) repeat protein
LPIAITAVGVEQRLEQVVAERPQSPKAHLDLAEWHLMWNDTAKALEILRRALEVDPEHMLHAWRYHERMGDIHYDYRHEVEKSKSSYQAALQGNPRSRRSLLRYGGLQLWDGEYVNATKLFSDAASFGLLRDPQQRPIDEFLAEIPADTGAWVNSENYMFLDDAMETLADKRVIEVLQEEYNQWSSEYGAKDSLVSMESDPRAPGRHLQFWIHRPHYSDGIWRDVCAHETPKICQALKSLNESGGIQINQASFEILETGSMVRAQCHRSNAELFIDICLQAPSGPVFTAVGEEQRPWVTGEVGVLDGSYEHVMANQAVGEPAVSLRLVVRHPHLPCGGGFEVCGIRGTIANAWRNLRRRLLGAPNDIGGDDLSDEL